MGNIFQISNQSNIDAARVGFHVGFLSQLEETAPDPVEATARVVPSTTALEQWEWLGDLPGFTEWKGDRVLSEIDAFKMVVANRDWANGLRLHENHIADDRLGLFGDTTGELARVARAHRGTLMAQSLLNGFNGVAFPDAGNGLAYDGAFFFSDSHSTGGGPAQSNKMTAVLGATGLSLARQKLREMRTADGARSLNVRPTHLVVGPKNEETAEKLMKNDTVPNAAGTASESNIHKGKYQIIVSPELVDDYDDYWFLGDLSRNIRPLIFQLRQEITPESVAPMGGQATVPSFQRGELWFGARARYATAYFAWQLIVGSTGAG